MPERLLKSHVVLGTILLAVFYLLMAIFIPTEFLVEILNGTFLGVSVALFVVYWRLWWFTIRLARQEYHRADQYALGTEIAWLATFLNRGYAAYLRIEGISNSTTDTHWVGIFVYMWIIGGALQVTSPGMYRGLVSGRDKWTLYISAAVGTLVGVTVVLAQAWGTGFIELP